MWPVPSCQSRNASSALSRLLLSSMSFLLPSSLLRPVLSYSPSFR